MGIPRATLIIADNAVAQTGIDLTPVLLTGWQKAGVQRDMTADYANSRIICLRSDIYDCFLVASFLGSANTIFEIHFRVNGVEADFGIHRKVSGGDAGSATAAGPIPLTVGDVLTAYVESDNGSGASLTLIDAAFWTKGEGRA